MANTEAGTLVEEWHSVCGYENFYQVSTVGRVRSLDRYVDKGPCGIHLQPGRILKLGKKPAGYMFATLCVSGFQKCCNVHRLVAEAIIENPLKKAHVNHINGLKWDNRVSNLEWTTAKENAQHAIRIGLTKKQVPPRSFGEKNGQCKLSPAQVIEIRADRSAGKTYVEIAKKFLISDSQARRIATGLRQSHIQNQL